MAETVATYGAIALVLGAILWIGIARDMRTGEAIKSYAERHGLEFREGNLLKGIKPQAVGRIKGWKVSIGSQVIETYTKGIGPSNRDVWLEARLELPDDSYAQPSKLQDFLASGGGLSGRSIMLYFPKRYLSPITYEELDQTVGRLIEAAEKARR